MVSISTYTQLAGTRLGGTSQTSQAKAVSGSGGVNAPAAQRGTSSSVSTLARQLSEAADRAEARSAGVSHKALGEKAASIVDQIVGNTYAANKAKHDAEVPDTEDPALLARAKQATDFVNGKASNPFQAMTRDQLALIAYDESGTFTVNERRAAWQEAYDQEEAWRQKVVQKAMDEYNRTGKLTNFFTEVLEHYKGLPAIEQAQYPEDYASQLQGWIDRDFNYMTHQAEGMGKSSTNLIEQLVGASPYADQKAVAASVHAAFTSAEKSSASTGHILMVSRLFGGTEPAVANGAQGMAASNIGRSAYEYLTSEDRALLSEMYGYAQEQGADLTYVDRLAEELGDYRQHDNGRLRANFNNGTHYDTQGRQLTISFNDRDAATAERILTGTAINSTKLDQGFLRHILNPGYGALSNTSDFEFLERMVVKFSGEGTAPSELDARFASYTPVKDIKNNVILTASEDAKLPPFEPDIMNVNGVWTVTEKGRVAGITLDDLIGKSGRPAAVSTEQQRNRYILDAFLSQESSSQDAKRTDWLRQLLGRQV